mgnify:FL=1
MSRKPENQLIVAKDNTCPSCGANRVPYPIHICSNIFYCMACGYQINLKTGTIGASAVYKEKCQNEVKMELVGIYKDNKYHHARGIYKGNFYRIIEEVPGKFLLETKKIMPGLGFVAFPVAFFDDSWEGLYYE